MTPEEIRTLRQDMGCSQQGLADQINKIDPLLRANRQTVYRWERGDQTPGAHSASVLATLRKRQDKRRTPDTPP